MLITNDELNYCLDKARDIAEQYKLYHIASDDPRRSVDKLMETCRARLSVAIALRKLSIHKDESAVWGAYLKEGDNRYTICYVDGLNYCWERFTVCKELFHVILDREEYRNMD